MGNRRDKEAFVHQLFDEIAQVYDPMNRILTFGLWPLWQRAFRRKLPPLEGRHVLDVACGTGDLSLLLAKAVGPDGRVSGLDLSERMLEVARRKLAHYDEGRRIEFVAGNAMALPFPDGTFDGAAIGFALRNVADVPQTLREMKRVVRPGGVVISLELSQPEVAWFKPLYFLYFYHVVPWIGRMAGRGADPYSWLPASLRGFPNRHALAHMFREVGLEGVESWPLSFGAVAIHRGFCPNLPPS